ncbi:hypothetical protein C8Q74DRAFT_148845 [Fomes fomentarius]|nr:hypothetical protein C8Q74DRAFT_148845 [Fomes fomentarius]
MSFQSRSSPAPHHSCPFISGSRPTAPADRRHPLGKMSLRCRSDTPTLTRRASSPLLRRRGLRPFVLSFIHSFHPIARRTGMNLARSIITSLRLPGSKPHHSLMRGCTPDSRCSHHDLFGRNTRTHLAQRGNPNAVSALGSLTDGEGASVRWRYSFLLLPVPTRLRSSTRESQAAKGRTRVGRGVRATRRSHCQTKPPGSGSLPDV